MRKDFTPLAFRLSFLVASGVAAGVASGTTLTATPLALPGPPAGAARATGAGGGAVSMDYLAYDPAHARLWVPAGNTGRVDVVDTKTGQLTPIDDFPTLKRQTPRGERLVGPSSATVGAGMVYIGNRADSKVCAVDGKTLKRGGCVALPSSPDGLAYVATTKEVWVTTPRDKSITILDVKRPDAPALAGKITLDGEPEGFAVDEKNGIFYTNLEDKDVTLVIAARDRKITATWKPGCGEAGPRGLALDDRQHLLLVACTDKAVTLSLQATGTGGPAGAVRGQLATGAGVDAIDFDAVRRLLYVPSGKTATLSVLRVDQDGALTQIAGAPTAPGARVVVLDGSGTAYVADSAGGRLLMVHPPR